MGGGWQGLRRLRRRRRRHGPAGWVGPATPNPNQFSWLAPSVAEGSAVASPPARFGLAGPLRVVVLVVVVHHARSQVVVVGLEAPPRIWIPRGYTLCGSTVHCAAAASRAQRRSDAHGQDGKVQECG